MIQAVNLRWKTTVLIVFLFFIFFIGMESFAHARAGGGRSSGSRGFTSGSGSRSSQGTTTRPTQQPGITQPTPAQPTSPGMGRSFLSGLGGGLLGGMIGSMLFGGRAGAASGGDGGFGFGDLIIILAILAIVFFVIKRFRARKAMEMSSTGAAYAPSSYSYNEPAKAYILRAFITRRVNHSGIGPHQ